MDFRPKLFAPNQAKLLAGYPAKCFLTLKCGFRVPDPGLDGGEQEVVHAEYTKTETDSSVIGLEKRGSYVVGLNNRDSSVIVLKERDFSVIGLKKRTLL